ncbi:MAG: lysophospholipid acyltransferase family protein [Bdellovibrionia bacterium]
MVTPAQKRRLFRDLEKSDPEFTEKVVPFLEGLYKHYFRCEVTGWENVPDGTVLFVGNHNGVLTFEVLMIFYAWLKRFNGRRRALGLAHNVALNNPFFRWIIPKLGAIPANPEIAYEALHRGYSLLVYPGGLKESFRPFKDRKKVDFFQHKGFVRLALKARKPMVPIVSIGAHESYLILNRGDKLAEALGLKEKFRIPGIPLTYRSVFFAWLVASGMLTFFPLLLAPAAFLAIFIPLPAKMTFRILPAIDVCSMVDPNLSEEENLQKIYDYVVGEMQRVLTDEYKMRKAPVVG